MKRVVVLRGGPSSEYGVSMKSGSAVISALREQPYIVKDIVITKSGQWLDSGIIRNPDQALTGVDVVFIALHGRYGEDGEVQKIVQRLNIPFTGSRSLPSAVAFNKQLSKDAVQTLGIRTPAARVVRTQELYALDSVIGEIATSIGHELFIKPVADGSSYGASYIPSVSALKEHLPALLSAYDAILVEEYIRGREATVGVIEGFRGERHYALPAIEIIPPRTESFFSTTCKYDGSTNELCPGRFSYSEKSQLADAAIAVHSALGLSHYSRSDFIVRDGVPYFLEVNTAPGLTSESLFPKAAAAVGLHFEDLVQYLIETARVD